MNELIDYYRLVAEDQRRDILPMVPHQLTMMAYLPRQLANVGYTIGHVELVRGPFDPASMREACSRVLAHHGALRAAIDLDGRYPVQRVADEVAVDRAFLHLDLGGVPTEQAYVVLGEEARFLDPGAAPQLRVAVGRLGEDLHAVWVAAQHFFVDGEAYQALVARLWSHYQHVAGFDRTPRWGPPAQPYSAYVEGLSRRFRDPVAVEPHRAYWRAVHASLAAAGGMTALLPDRGPGGQEGRRAEWAIEWSGPELGRLRSVCTSLGIGPTTLIWSCVRAGLESFVPLEDVVSTAVLTASSGHEESMRDPVSLRLGDAVALFPGVAGGGALEPDVLRDVHRTLLLTQRHSAVPGSLVTRELPDDLVGGWTTTMAQSSPGHKLMLNVTDDRRARSAAASPGLRRRGMPRGTAEAGGVPYAREIADGVDRADYALPIIKIRIDHHDDRISTSLNYDGSLYSDAMFSKIGDGLGSAMERITQVPDQ